MIFRQCVWITMTSCSLTGLQLVLTQKKYIKIITPMIFFAQKLHIIQKACQQFFLDFNSYFNDFIFLNKPTVQVRIEFELLTGLWAIKVVMYCSHLQLYALRQKILWWGVSESVCGFLETTEKKSCRDVQSGGSIMWYPTLTISDIHIGVENIPISMCWTLNQSLRWWSW